MARYVVTSLKGRCYITQEIRALNYEANFLAISKILKWHIFVLVGMDN